ncbi:hypothetical protein M9Y10_031742 [Tritrichomonas musculus]|uniref:Initiator binding domain-containing protein n=1 Tax=Tritrichomonas musculus TaxID=1915356 RepID=A0ABR2GZN2_9EUKA
MTKHQQGPHGIPEYIDLLSDEDKRQYEELQKKVGSPNFRYNRNHRLDTLKDIFDCIKDFCEKSDKDKWKRYLVCGICWFDDYIAINTRQLRLLISKSKSAINGALVKMGYITVSVKGERASLLLETIPFLSGHFIEFRKWSIRKKNPSQDEIARVKRCSKKKGIIKNQIENCCDDENDCDIYDELFKDIVWDDECCKPNFLNECDFNILEEEVFPDDENDFNEGFSLILSPHSSANLNKPKDVTENISFNDFKNEETSKVF